MPDAKPPMVTLARQAMATRFEIVLPGDNPVALRAAGEEALDEIERLEAQLSLYRSTSEVAHLNALAASRFVRVEPGLFRLISQAKRLSEQTSGLFDITIAPLMRCWGLMGGEGRVPTPAELEEARSAVGMHLVELDPTTFAIRFVQPGVMLDFGAIGKGYAIERAAQLLQEAGITSALIHGGTSTVYGLGLGPDDAPWKVAIEYPSTAPDAAQEIMAVVPLHNEALSVSAVWGKFFTVEGKTYGHVMDPRAGAPVSKGLLAAVIHPSATESDALSTALLAGGASVHELIARLQPGMRTLLVEQAAPSEPRMYFQCGIDIRKRGLQRI
jgi:thiamine biosynthesis lipoprotein